MKGMNETPARSLDVQAWLDMLNLFQDGVGNSNTRMTLKIMRYVVDGINSNQDAVSDQPPHSTGIDDFSSFSVSWELVDAVRKWEAWLEVIDCEHSMIERGGRLCAVSEWKTLCDDWLYMARPLPLGFDNPQLAWDILHGFEHWLFNGQSPALIFCASEPCGKILPRSQAKIRLHRYYCSLPCFDRAVADYQQRGRQKVSKQ